MSIPGTAPAIRFGEKRREALRVLDIRARFDRNDNLDRELVEMAAMSPKPVRDFVKNRLKERASPASVSALNALGDDPKTSVRLTAQQLLKSINEDGEEGAEEPE